MRFLLRVVLVSVVRMQPASASTEAAQPLSTTVSRSDFIGVVECTRAGVGMGQFAVLECWKGDSTLEECVIRLHHDEFGGCFEVAYVGQRFLVAAKWTKRTPKQSPRIRPRLPEPWRWWGWTPDLEVERTDAMERIIERKVSWRALGYRSMSPTLESLRREVFAILALSPEALELRFLRDEVELRRAIPLFRQYLPPPPPARSVREFLSMIVAASERHSMAKEGGADCVFTLLRASGREETLRYAKEGGALPIPADRDAKDRQEFIEVIEARLAREADG